MKINCDKLTWWIAVSVAVLVMAALTIIIGCEIQTFRATIPTSNNEQLENGDAKTGAEPGSPPTSAAAPIKLAWYDAEWGTVLNYFHFRESRNGSDPKCREVGPRGEEGEYQITPIFIADVFRICGYRINPHDNESCREGIAIWLDYYTPLVAAGTINDLHELYRHGAKGYREWR